MIDLTTGVKILATSQHLRIPAIVPLLLDGIFLGQEISGLIDPATIESYFDVLVAGLVAVIVF